MKKELLGLTLKFLIYAVLFITLFLFLDSLNNNDEEIKQLVKEQPLTELKPLEAQEDQKHVYFEPKEIYDYLKNEKIVTEDVNETNILGIFIKDKYFYLNSEKTDYYLISLHMKYASIVKIKNNKPIYKETINKKGDTEKINYFYFHNRLVMIKHKYDQNNQLSEEDIDLMNTENKHQIYGVEATYFENGILQNRCEYMGLLKHGVCDIWYENGILKAMIPHRYGKAEGTSKAYYENGRLEAITEFTDGLQNGVSESFYENGICRDKAFYRAGKADGRFLSYYENGNIYIDGNFENGKKNGNAKIYYENSQLEYDSQFVDDRLMSQKCFNENGKLIFELSNRYDETNSSYEEHTMYADGSYEVSEYKLFKDDYQIVSSISYFSNKNKKAVYTYIDGMRDGKSEIYYKDGTYKGFITWKADKRDGITKAYYKSGRLLLHTEFRDNKSNGLTIIYNEDGTVLRKINRKNSAYLQEGSLPSEAPEILKQYYEKFLEELNNS